MSGDQVSPGTGAVRIADESDEVAAFCARLACRREYRRVTQPGRPQQYCSQVCRRAAEKEIRQLRARLHHFKGVVTQIGIDLAAHGRDDDEDVATGGAKTAAVNALARSAGVLRFVSDSDLPIADELKLLYEAVRPVLEAEA
jgi:hypothetical protein